MPKVELENGTGMGCGALGRLGGLRVHVQREHVSCFLVMY